MNLTIKPLTPELAADYFDFFENRAFTDDSPYRCYCQVYQMTKAQMTASCKMIEVDGLDPGCASRKIAEQQIMFGALRGYLAFVDGLAIGWCNANDRANFPSECRDGERFYAPAEKREKAVVCFEIAPDFRGKGIATSLLQRVVSDAIIEGYTAVVGFPVKRDARYEWDCRGPLRLYEMAGFVKADSIQGAGSEELIVMRKELV